jgi:hypothetical protein
MSSVRSRDPGPRLVFLRRFTDLAAEQGQGLPEAVRVEIGQAGRRERCLEDRPDPARAAPVFAVEARGLEKPGVPDHDPCRRE